VERERKRNMYFSAIGFIYDVKKGPFWEHSPILYDVSGVKAGWAKINRVSRTASYAGLSDIRYTVSMLTCTGYDKDVQRRSALQIPCSPALSFRILVCLG
jgi:hypothetical protein